MARTIPQRGHSRVLGALAAAACALAAGCGAERPADEARLGELLYRSHGCGSCHGAEGRGDGPLARSLRSEVPDLTRGELRHGSTAEAVADIIGRGVGSMPPFDHIGAADRLVLARWVVALAAPPAQRPRGLQVNPGAARATPPGVDRSAGYLTISNGGAEDALIEVRSPAAGSAALHRSTLEGGVMRMRPVEHLPLPPGETVRLEPGGLHLMLLDLRAPLRPGDSVVVELRFRDHPPVTVELPVVHEVSP